METCCGGDNIKARICSIRANVLINVICNIIERINTDGLVYFLEEKGLDYGFYINIRC